VNIGQIVNKPAIRRLNRSDPVLIDNTTLLGIEVEVENFTYPDVKAREWGYWSDKKDDSLRNNGMELVFNEPFNGADAVTAVKWLFEQAQKKQWRVSKLTGIHVHLDVREMEVEEFRAFCVLYALTEPLIYKWIGRSRFENMFCLPWYMADSDVGTISKALNVSAKDTGLALSFLKQLSKYSGLNVSSAPKFGTVEFRMMETHFDFGRMMDWLNIILSLKMKAVQMPKPEEIPKTLSHFGPAEFARWVFGDNLTKKMWYPDYTKDAIGLGMVTADWFLNNTQELELQGKSLGEKFSITRKRSLSTTGSTKETHKGVSKWTEKYSVIRKVAAKKADKVKAPQYGGALYGEAAAWQAQDWIQVNGVVPPPQAEPNIEIFDEIQEEEP
jgi:hypothetical protein